MQIYYNRPGALEALKYTEFLEKYNTLAKQPKYYGDNPDTENNVSLDCHYFKVHMDAAGVQYVYCPVRQVKRCIRIEMLLRLLRLLLKPLRTCKSMSMNGHQISHKLTINFSQ